MFFRKGMFGAFVLPFVSLSIILSLFGFFFSLYLLLKNLAITSYAIFYSSTLNASFFHLNNLIFYPSIIFIYLLFLFITSISYYNYILTKTGHQKRSSFREIFKMSFYTLIYLLIYPIVWVVSIYRYSTNDMKW